MKVFALLLISLFSNCNQHNDSEIKKENDSNVVHRNTFDTAGKKSFKGWELYSWFNKGWKFALVYGTNRIKTIDEIASQEIRDEMALADKINELQNNEIIGWVDGKRIKNPQMKKILFQRPPPDIIDKITAACKNKNIEILNLQ